MSLPENHLEIAGGVGVFTLNRPRALNAISQAMFEHDLPDMVARIEADDSLRVLILTGAGGNFCSGADVKRMGGANMRTPEERDAGLRSDDPVHFLELFHQVELRVQAAGRIDDDHVHVSVALRIDDHVAQRKAVLDHFDRLVADVADDSGGERSIRLRGLGKRGKYRAKRLKWIVSVFNEDNVPARPRHQRSTLPV